MTAIGIIAGITAATLQSLSYLFSRAYVMRKYGSPIQLVLVSQLFMGLLCLPVIALSWCPETPQIKNYLLPLLICTGTYILGQTALFAAMRHTQASRVSPMLGFKIVVIALITFLFFDEQISSRQWSGVAIAISAVILLNASGGRLPLKSLTAVAAACVSYAISDIYIARLIQSLQPLPVIRASIYATSVSYALAGSISLAVLIAQKRLPAVRHGMPFSLAFAVIWLLAMFALFLCFGSVGAVMGNILQSSRGVISILIAIPAVKLGFPVLEPSSPRRVTAQRLAAAMLIIAAVWLYK